MNSWRIKIQRAAKEDLRSGYEFYNAQEFGLGNYFYDCLMSDIDALAYYGGVHRQYHGFYKALSSRFPYAIYYKLSEGFVKVYAVLDNVRALPGYLSFVQTHDASSGTAAPYGMVTIVSTMAWGLGYFGMPHILVRFMAIRDENELKLSRRIASIWVVISMTVAICIGMIGYGVSKAGRIPMLEGSASETVIVKIADLLSSYGIIPAVIAGLILAGILAATMSTADSQLLSAASAFSENMLQDVFGVKLTAKQTMLVARLTVIVIAVIAAFLATDPNSSVFQIVSFAWAGFGATFGPAILFALFWRRSNRQGILAGLVAGGVMVFVWKFCVRPMGGAWNVYELLPAFIVASVVIVVVSLLTEKPDASIEKTFDEVNAM